MFNLNITMLAELHQHVLGFHGSKKQKDAVPDLYPLLQTTLESMECIGEFITELSEKTEKDENGENDPLELIEKVTTLNECIERRFLICMVNKVKAQIHMFKRTLLQQKYIIRNIWSLLEVCEQFLLYRKKRYSSQISMENFDKTFVEDQKLVKSILSFFDAFKLEEMNPNMEVDVTNKKFLKKTQETGSITQDFFNSLRKFYALAESIFERDATKQRTMKAAPATTPTHRHRRPVLGQRRNALQENKLPTIKRRRSSILFQFGSQELEIDAFALSQYEKNKNFSVVETVSSNQYLINLINELNENLKTRSKDAKKRQQKASSRYGTLRNNLTTTKRKRAQTKETRYNKERMTLTDSKKKKSPVDKENANSNLLSTATKHLRKVSGYFTLKRKPSFGSGIKLGKSDMKFGNKKPRKKVTSSLFVKQEPTVVHQQSLESPVPKDEDYYLRKYDELSTGISPPHRAKQHKITDFYDEHEFSATKTFKARHESISGSLDFFAKSAKKKSTYTPRSYLRKHKGKETPKPDLDKVEHRENQKIMFEDAEDLEEVEKERMKFKKTWDFDPLTPKSMKPMAWSPSKLRKQLKTVLHNSLPSEKADALKFLDVLHEINCDGADFLLDNTFDEAFLDTCGLNSKKLKKCVFDIRAYWMRYLPNNVVLTSTHPGIPGPPSAKRKLATRELDLAVTPVSSRKKKRQGDHVSSAQRQGHFGLAASVSILDVTNSPRITPFSLRGVDNRPESQHKISARSKGLTMLRDVLTPTKEDGRFHFEKKPLNLQRTALLFSHKKKNQKNEIRPGEALKLSNRKKNREGVKGLQERLEKR